MALVQKLVLLEFSPSQMFELVDRVEDYPQFLPWCGGTELLERSENRTVATLHINYHGIRSHFSTENSKQHPTHMSIRLREGPFRHLDGTWNFVPLGTEASKVEFKLHYEFSSRLLEKALGPVFNHIANSFVECFIQRAGQVYPKHD